MEAERSYKELIWQDSDRVSGAICFYGTRIPVQHLIDHLESGYTLKEFSDAFALQLARVQAVLALASKGLESYLTEAA
jgi:uncharacterized protein (DUF433 family)